MKSKFTTRLILLIGMPFLALSYNCVGFSKQTYSKDVVSSLEMAGDNKNELIKALEHYRKSPKDSLKFRAICFLLSNMKAHYSLRKIDTCPSLVKQSYKKVDSLTKTFFFVEDSSLFRFTEHMHNILDTQDFNPTKSFVDSLIKRTYPKTEDTGKHKEKFLDFENNISIIAQELLKNIDTLKQANGIYPDLENITSQWLIDHIDNAFSHWKASPFAKTLSFDEFVNTLLSYRSMTESVDKTSSFIRNNFYNIIHSKDSFNIENVVRRLNFATYCLDVFEDNGRNLGNLGFYDILQFYKFDCDRHAQWTTRVLNACGVPAYLDYTSGFFNRDKLHYGVSVRDTSGIYHHYTAKWQQLGDSKHQNEFSKVYRQMYAVQKCPVTIADPDEIIPDIFKNPYMKDVTDEYQKVTDISIPYRVSNTYPKRKLGYLAIFMPSGWKPVAWGEIDYAHNKINFEKVNLDAMYIAGVYDNKGFVPISNPLYVDSDCKISESIPSDPITLRLTRKFPLKQHLIEFMKEMIGAKIQGANNKDFSDADDLYTLKLSDMSDFSVKSLPISSKRKFRYIRCISDETPLNIGTFEVFSSVNPKVKVNVGSMPAILSEDDIAKIDIRNYSKLNGSLLPSSQDVNKAFDGNQETYVTAFSIGIDLGSPQRISQIRFAPRNANNGIVIGDNYELLYYNKGWKSSGTKLAEYNFLKFEGIPSNTIYWLRNKDQGKEELSFTYKDDEQLFINQR